MLVYFEIFLKNSSIFSRSILKFTSFFCLVGSRGLRIIWGTWNILSYRLLCPISWIVAGTFLKMDAVDRSAETKYECLLFGKFGTLHTLIRRNLFGTKLILLEDKYFSKHLNWCELSMMTRYGWYSVPFELRPQSGLPEEYRRYGSLWW